MSELEKDPQMDNSEVPTTPSDDIDEPQTKIEQFAEEIVEEVEEAMEAVLPPHLRMRAWAKRRPVTNAVWRAAVLLIGIALVIAGVLMLIFPGPGWVTIFLGLAVLSSEFAWAHTAYQPLKRLFDWAMRRAKERTSRKAK